MNEWQDISTAPFEQDILVYGLMIGMLVVERDLNEDADFPWLTLDGPNYFHSAFTHWRPLPEPPESK